MLSVICPIYNEEKYLSQFLESILLQDYPINDTEILLVDGMSDDRTREIAAEYARKYQAIRLIDNPKRTAPCAMNIGIKESKGDIIIRLDAHANYPPNYFSTLAKQLEDLDADNVGAVCKTDVLHKHKISLAIREVLSNPFGVGNSTFRIGVNKIMEVDTVPFGCWKRATFEKFGMYDERLIRNQDFELNKRIIENGGKIFIVPDTFSTYYARENLSSLWRQNFLNGIWGIRTILFTGRTDSLAIRHYIPMIFILSLIIPLVIGFFWHPIWLLGILSLSSYLLSISIISSIVALKKHLNVFCLMAAFATLHISNGVGMLASIFTSRGYIKHINNQTQSL